MMKIWKLGCGNEVKGEGYILNLILYSFFRIFGKTRKSEKWKNGFFSLPRVYIKKSFQTFTIHLFIYHFVNQFITGEGWWRVFCIFYKHILRIQPIFTYFKYLFSIPKWVPFLEGPLFNDFFLLKSQRIPAWLEVLMYTPLNNCQQNKVNGCG